MTPAMPSSYVFLWSVAIRLNRGAEQGMRAGVCVCVCVVNGAELLQSVKADCNGVIWNAIGKG